MCEEQDQPDGIPQSNGVWFAVISYVPHPLSFTLYSAWLNLERNIFNGRLHMAAHMMQRSRS